VLFALNTTRKSAPLLARKFQYNDISSRQHRRLHQTTSPRRGQHKRLRHTMKIESFFDTRTFTVTYVAYDEATRDAVVIDPVLDYEPMSAKTWTESVRRVMAYVEENDLRVRAILETHAHADHLSGSQVLKKVYPNAQIVIGDHIRDVQTMFKGIFDLPAEFATDGRQFDVLLADGQTFEAGSIRVNTIYTPGHTPACVNYLIEDALFTGDTLFMPDMGTGRCDFPGGSANDMYDSIQRLYALPDATRVFVGHDYAPGGREYAWETTIAAEKAHNIQLNAATTRDAYTTARTTRDKTLEAPKLLFQSVQVNIDAGHLPARHDNNIRYLRIPMNVFRPDKAGDIELMEV
jgi:glyoxylase-like metal-dependent hydrolase (beta-lactamase superfamily II)